VSLPVAHCTEILNKTSDVTLAVNLADIRHFRVGRNKCANAGLEILV
jgi:hypothetical protein